MRIFTKMRTVALTAALALTATATRAADQTTLAHWSFNYAYDISDGIGTPSSTAQSGNSSVNLHGVKLAPDENVVSGAYLTAFRPTTDNDANAVVAQAAAGAYLETKSISCDGAALHLTSPVPTPNEESTSWTYGSATETFADGKSYSYQNPYNYFEIEINTAAYKNVELEVKAAGHRSSEQYYAVAYSTDGSSWTVVGDEYLTGASYNKWTTNTIALAGIDGKEKAYIRIFPADDWKGSGSSVNSDNQFNLDDVYVRGEIDADIAEITAMSVNGEAAAAGSDYDYDVKLPQTYTDATITIAPTAAFSTLTAQAAYPDGTTEAVTANSDGTFTIATPAANTYYIVTFTVAPTGDAVVQQETYTLKVFHIGDISLTAVTVDGTAISDELLATLNDTKAATFSDNIYTKTPVVAATVIDGSTPSVSSSFSDTAGTYTITAGDSIYNLTVEGIHLYEMTENDEEVTIQYTGDGVSAYEADDEWPQGWTDGLYTLRTTKLDGWGNAQFKFNSSDFKFEVPGGVVVKSFAFQRFGANYGDGEGITAFTSDGATCWVPTAHGYKQGNIDTVTVVLDNHKAGEPIYFSITGGNQPYSEFHLIVEKVNAGTAPEVKSTETTVAFNHAVVAVSFDREVQASTVSFNGSDVTAAGGSTLYFNVYDLSYGTDYTFTIPAGAVEDLFGNKTSEDITVTIAIPEKAAVEKKPYDYVVGTADELSAAITEIGKSTDASVDRIRIFLKNGDYDFGENELRIYRGNVSLIGQDRDSVIIHGTRTGISNPVLNIRDRQGFYLQDLTVRNDLDFGTERVGVGVAIYGGNKSIMKNVCMQSQQDTQVTGERSYYDGCRIHGTVDFICGGGNHFYDQCDLIIEGNGIIAAPATSSTLDYGYVFSGCTISAAENSGLSDGAYTLARPWQNEPRTYYINTTMNLQPTANGYSGMSSLPTHFYEYGSVDSEGNTIDLSGRGNSNTSTNSYTPVLTADEAATYTIANVLGEHDAWLPTDYTALTDAPAASVSDHTISWEAMDDALCYVVFKDGEFVDDITDTSITVDSAGTYLIYSANEMGGLSKTYATAVVADQVDGIREVGSADAAVAEKSYNLAGQKVGRAFKGIVIKEGKKVIVR